MVGDAAAKKEIGFTAHIDHPVGNDNAQHSSSRLDSVAQCLAEVASQALIHLFNLQKGTGNSTINAFNKGAFKGTMLQATVCHTNTLLLASFSHLLNTSTF